MSQNKQSYQTLIYRLVLFLTAAALIAFCLAQTVQGQSPFPVWVSITPAADCSAGCWRLDLERSEYWNESESQGLHHAFAIALDPHGNQVAGLPFTVAYPTGADTVLTKPTPDWADIPLWASFDPNQGEVGPYWAYMGTGGGNQSEHVRGLGLPLNAHVSYRLVFVWQDNGGGTATPTATLTVTPTPTATPAHRLWLPMVRK